MRGVCGTIESVILDIPISKRDQRGIEVSVPQAGRERDKQIYLCELVFGWILRSWNHHTSVEDCEFFWNSNI